MLADNLTLHNFNGSVKEHDFIKMLDSNLKDKLEEILCLAKLLEYEWDFELIERINYYYTVFKFTLNNKFLYLHFSIPMTTKTIEQIRFYKIKNKSRTKGKDIVSKKNDLIDQIKTIDKFKTFL